MIIIPFDKNCNDSTVTIIMKLFRQANIWTKYVKIHCQLSYISLLILSNLSKNKDRKMWGGLGKLGIMLYAWLSMSGYLLYWNLLVYREMHLQCWSVRHYWIFLIFFFFFFLKKKCKIFDRAFPNFTSWYYRQTVDNRSSKKHFLWRKSDQILSILKALLDPFTKWYKRLTLRSTKFWVKSTLDRAS